MGRRVAVLGFHKIGEPTGGDYPTWNYIPSEDFLSYLAILKEDGWTVVDLARFTSGLQRPDALPEKTALITFDDGYVSTLTEALPCLQRYGWPAVVFVPTALIGGTNAFDKDIEPEEKICSWDQLRELQRWGISVQSHGVTHRAFSELSAAARNEELGTSRRVLEEELARGVTAFAYPYGDDAHPELTPAMMRAQGYDVGFRYGGDPTTPADARNDCFRIPRLALGRDCDLRAMLAASAA
jgi:peptidoglycan/xylan/chitin deacetylase (PgdA/CDA1 family)